MALGNFPRQSGTKMTDQGSGTDLVFPAQGCVTLVGLPGGDFTAAAFAVAIRMAKQETMLSLAVRP